MAHAAAKSGAPHEVVLADTRALLQGPFDNREQVRQAKDKMADASEQAVLPHVAITIEATPQSDWSLWRIRLDADADTSIETTWAVQTRVEGDGSLALVPYYLFKPTAPPSAQTFDAQAWLSLEGCALRGEFGKSHIKANADGMPCMVVATGIGAQRALLPVAIERDGDWLHVDFILRGTATRIDARQSR